MNVSIGGAPADMLTTRWRPPGSNFPTSFSRASFRLSLLVGVSFRWLVKSSGGFSFDEFGLCWGF